MDNYRKGKERFKPNNLGSLYIKGEYNKENPTIYVGGQMEHRLHILEQTGFTGDAGHNMFDGSWFYDYPLIGNVREYNARNFAKNLVQCLDEAKLENVTLITESAGGLVGAYASKSPRIQKVLAIHPPILGTPLADWQIMENGHLDFTREEKALMMMLKIIVNRNYGFERDNLNGVMIDKVNLDKLIVISSKLNAKTDKLGLAVKYHDLILKSTGLESDGVVVYEPKELARLGIKYLENEPELNHIDAGRKEYLADVYKRRKIIK